MEHRPIAIINPEITPLGDEVVEDWEGCLSIPDIRGRVPRAREIRLRGFDRFLALANELMRALPDVLVVMAGSPQVDRGHPARGQT